MAGSTDIGGIHYTVDTQTDSLLKAARDVDQSSKRMEKSLDGVDSGSQRAGRSLDKLKPIAAAVRTVAMSGAVALTGFGVAMIALARNASQAAKELQNQARLAGVSVEAFQQLAYGAKSVGVEQEKLGDIFKDAQDKVGDFLSTGGGEMADYFQKVAPLVGQTADEFRGLTGPQVLMKLQKGLDDANLSMEQQVFFLESVADEASLLQPLLTNNAQGFQSMAKEARDTNAVLSRMEIDRLNELSRAFSQLEQQLNTETSRAILNVDNLLKSMIEGSSKGLTTLARGFNLFLESFRDNDAKRSIEGINEELAKVFDNKRRLESRIELFGEDSQQGQDAIAAMEEVKAEYDQLIDRKKELMQMGVAVPETLELDRAETDTPPRSTPLPGLGDDDAASNAKKERERLAREMERRRQDIEMQLASESEAIYREYQERDVEIQSLYADGSAKQKELLIKNSEDYQEKVKELKKREIEEEKAAYAERIANLTGFTTEATAKLLEMKENVENPLAYLNEEFGNSISTLDDTVANAFMSAVTQGKQFDDVLKTIGRTILASLLQSVVKLGVQMAVNAAMGQVYQQAANQIAVQGGAQALAAWQPAAIAASIATYGAAAGIGAGAYMVAQSTAGAVQASSYSSSGTGDWASQVSTGSGRAHGGPVSAGMMRPVGEGGKPEIFNDGTSSYLLPGSNGEVFSNRDVMSAQSYLSPRNTSGVGRSGVNMTNQTNITFQITGSPDESTLEQMRRMAEEAAEQGASRAYDRLALEIEENSGIGQRINSGH